MTYDAMLGWSQIVSMSIFGCVMMGVLIYALRPANRARFETAARLPILIDEDDEISLAGRSLTALEEGTRHGRA